MNNPVYEVLGFRDVNFTDDSGRQVKGISLFARTPSVDSGWHGHQVDKFFINNEQLQLMGFQPVEGMLFTPTFNRYGKICAVQVC